MGELLMRRREMILPSESSPLVFSLENQAVSAGDSISTGFAAFADGVACTILLEFTLTERPASGNGANFKLIWCGSGAPFQYGSRNAAASTTTMYYYWLSGGAYAMISNMSIENGARYRVAVMHEADSGTIYVRGKKNNATSIQKNSTTKTFSASANILCFGNPNHTQGLPIGVINSAKVYKEYYADDSDILTEFFA